MRSVFGAGTVKWKNEEMKKVNRKRRKVMGMCGVLHVDGTNLPKKVDRRGMVRVEI